MIDEKKLLGLNDSDIDFHAFECPIHHLLIPAVTHLKSEADRAGFDVRIVSGFRDFGRQLKIWNDKALGLRPLLDHTENIISPSSLTSEELIYAILRWSALPGTSRHHWGTDIDVIDANALGDNSDFQLTVSETLGDGVFSEFHRWLDGFLENQNSDFFRPYDKDRGGVSPEPWHLSHIEISKVFQENQSKAALSDVLREQEVVLCDEIIDKLDIIFDRFVINCAKV